MNKEEFIELLRNHKENKAELNIKLKELKTARIRLKDINYETSITSGFGINQDIKSKNKVSNKVLNKIEENDEIEENTKQKIEDLEADVRELREKVETVEDRLAGLKYKEKELLVAYHIDGRSYDDIGTNLYFKLFNQTRNWETVKKIVEKATQKMIDL